MHVTIQSIAVVLNLISVLLLIYAQRPLIEEHYGTYFYQEEEIKKKNELLKRKKKRQKLLFYTGITVLFISTAILLFDFAAH